MSDETWNAVEKAIQQHLADEHGGAFLTSWIVVAHGISAQDSNYSYYKYMSSDGPSHEKLGLLNMAMFRFQQSATHDDGDEEGEA
jgi:hypothetical protein